MRAPAIEAWKITRVIEKQGFPAFGAGVLQVKKGCIVRSFRLAGNARVKSNAHAWTFRSNGRIVRRA